MAMEFQGRLPLPKTQSNCPEVGGGDNTNGFCSLLLHNEPPKLLVAIRAGAHGEQDLW